MATYVFDGTANVSVANFDPAADTLIVDGVDIADVGTFTRSSTSFVIALDSGISVSLSGANLDALTDGNFSPTGGSDIDFAIGDGNPNNLTGNLGSGGFGADILQFNSDNAIIYGNQQNDTITGGAPYENLSLYGGEGNDRITGFGGGSIVYGGLGSDIVLAPGGLTDGVTIYGGNGSSDSTDGGDIIYGGGGNDLIYANGGTDVVAGYAGDDMLFGGAGNDTIYGDDNVGPSIGDDSIYGNAGDDYLISDGGSDFVFGGQGDDRITAYLGVADDQVLLSGNLGEDTINAFFAASANITVYGGNGASDTADGGDLISGSAQGDLIYANAGNDSVSGYAGDDTILGGAGDDLIDGSTGVNSLTGGTGADTFVAVSTAGAADYSVVTDFTTGADHFDVTTIPVSVTKITGTGATNYDTLAAVITDFGSAMVAGTAVSVTVTNGDLAGITFVLADDGGAGTADQVIALTGFTGTLTAADFV